MRYTATDSATPPNTATLPLSVGAETQTGDQGSPPLVFFSEVPAATNGVRSFDFAIYFNEPVTPLALGDIRVINAVLTPDNFSAVLGDSVMGGPSYQVNLTPTGGEVTLTVRVGAVADNDGNPNEATSVTIPLDTSAPLVSLKRAGTGAETGPFDITATFSEQVRALSESDFTISGGEIRAFTPTFNGDGAFREWTITIVPDADTMGMVTVDLAVARCATSPETKAPRRA